MLIHIILFGAAVIFETHGLSDAGTSFNCSLVPEVCNDLKKIGSVLLACITMVGFVGLVRNLDGHLATKIANEFLRGIMICGGFRTVTYT
mmetsp:Transcript_6551/g.8906  ORF Transcript_6551/g.8906 Transcript_6551/m.8906 type:complete len:90 (-) Transcript_6551:129-398(-)